MTTHNAAPEALLKRIRATNRFLISSHMNPDGDSVGSSLALAAILRSQGKGAVVWHRDPAPAMYRHLPGFESIHVGAEGPDGHPDLFDAVVALECPGLDRTGLEEEFGGLPILNIDHHLGNEHYGEINWIDSAAPSVGEMVYRLARALGVRLSADLATALLLTLVTDTGGFRFSNATPEAFEAAASLVREGARPELVAEWVYESRPESSIRLLAEVLRSLELTSEGRIATALMTREMMRAVGAAPSDGEGLIDHPRSIAGVQVVALLREIDGERTKVSLRSRGDYDVERIASRHGGGGHRNAAGFAIDGEPAAVRSQVIEELSQLFDSAA